ncbi:hypothetical protein [Sphingomonas jatrophae]|uniref:AcrB/AcrD/AcrF family protein n=1 Tax=Sphingomonas jatrophae TaxID=1166337 RepID=A0A1I6LP05_9SPHN|nr:hypothetical protein [Sphingomonas jatrophae]SFS05226.1 hypothetical protein SAMN05192580_3070 [Sphingomonas jatrophae]
METAPTPAPADPHRHWWRWAIAFWLVGAGAMLWYKWGGIYWFALSDTDDNLRIAEVRAWIAGQGWYDLRQYRLDPPTGASIHWSRLVDIPIAGLILLLKPILGGPWADRWAVAIAPMLPLLVAIVAAMLAVRRLVSPSAYALAGGLIFCGQAALLMFMPTRIDHHGWQLALLLVAVAGNVDPRARRGGIVAGAASATSLTIGLEMLPYIALMTGATALRWVWDAQEAVRLRAYGLALGIGAAIGFALFASYDNRALVCDVLSPVYLSVCVAGGGLFVGLAALKVERRDWRLAFAVTAAALLVIGFALAFPQCLGRPERISPELERLWFRNVREAKPLYQHPYTTSLPVITLPLIGMIGCLWSTWKAWGSERFAGWATTLLVSAFSCGLLLWQTRAGPAAQLLAIPGAAALGFAILSHTLEHRRSAVRVFGTLAGFLLVSGLFMPFLLRALPAPPDKKGYRARVSLANRRCPTLPALAPIARLPRATVLTFVDLGPRLIAVTHHNAIAGPYHRNGAAILDIHHAFRGSAETAHEVMRRHGATLLLICPGMSESTIYRAQAKTGFYSQISKGQVPGWLAPVPLPKNSPYKLWRRVD